MKKLFIKYWPFLGLVLSFVLDHEVGIIEHLVKDPFWIKTIYLFGALVYGYFFRSKHNEKTLKREQ